MRDPRERLLDFDIDADVVWEVVARDLPELRRGAEALLRRLP